MPDLFDTFLNEKPDEQDNLDAFLYAKPDEKDNLDTFLFAQPDKTDNIDSFLNSPTPQLSPKPGVLPPPAPLAPSFEQFKLPSPPGTFTVPPPAIVGGKLPTRPGFIAEPKRELPERVTNWKDWFEAFFSTLTAEWRPYERKEVKLPSGETKTFFKPKGKEPPEVKQLRQVEENLRTITPGQALQIGATGFVLGNLLYSVGEGLLLAGKSNKFTQEIVSKLTEKLKGKIIDIPPEQIKSLGELARENPQLKEFLLQQRIIPEHAVTPSVPPPMGTPGALPPALASQIPPVAPSPAITAPPAPLPAPTGIQPSIAPPGAVTRAAVKPAEAVLAPPVQPEKAIKITEQYPKPLPPSRIKREFRAATGQIKVSQLTNERTALKAVMRAQQRAAKTAFAEGKRTGVSIQKTHQERVAEAQAARQELRDRTASAIKTINKLPTENLPLDYKKKLETMKAGIDPRRRTAATLAKRVRLKEFVEQQQAAGEQINIPKKYLEMLNKKSVGEMTIEDTENLANAMKQVAHVGSVKGKLLKIREGKQVQATIDELQNTMAQIKGRRAIPAGMPVTEATKKQFLAGKARTGVRTYLQENKRPERILEALDNFETNGANYKTIYQPVEDASNESYAGQQAKTEVIQQAIKAQGLDLHKTVSETRFINNRQGEMSGEETIEVYQSTFDEDKLRHLKLGNKFTDKDINDIVAAMTPQERAYADWELNNYWRPQYAEINPHYEQLFNNSLPQTEGYSHIATDKDMAEFAPYEEDLAKELLGRQQIRAAFVERGFTKERLKGALQPLNLKHFDNLLRNIEKVEHFKAFAVRARDMRKILNHAEYKKAVTQAAGPETYKILKDWFSDVITRRPYTETPAASSVAMLRNHSAVAMLGFNVLTSMKQFPSLFTAASLTNSPAVLNGLQQVIRKPTEIESFVYAKSPQLKNRSVERDIQEVLRKANAAKVFAGKQSLAAKSMSLIRYIDKKVVLSVWKGSYDMAGKTMPEPEAIKFADQVVRRSQPAWEIKDLPAFFRGGELEKMLTMFMNQRNQNWNLFIHDTMGKAKAGKIGKLEALRRLWWIWVVPGFVLGSISRGRLKRTPKEAVLDFIKFSPLAGTFILGSLMDVLISGWDWSLPPFQAFKELGRAVKGKKPLTKIKHGAKAMGLFLGIPTHQPYRTTQGAIDLLNEKTHDLRRLLYSEYALREQEPGRTRRKRRKRKR